MFAKATRNFLKEVDADGNLIAVSNLNDSDKLQLLSLVTKKKRFWCWQKPKYQFLSLTLGDVLIEDQILSPVVVESDFVKYEGKFENHVSGSIETALGRVKLNVGGKGLVESQSSFGTLRKQEVDLQQLIREAVDRKINLRSPILQQVLAQPEEVLCVLTQKIVTTQKCVISEHVQIEERCGGMVGIQTKTLQVSATEDGNMVKDLNVVLEIPAAATIAYGVIELYVKQDGQFEFCLLQGKCGGFEQEQTNGRAPSMDLLPFGEFNFGDMPDGPREPLRILKQASQLSKDYFHPFVELSVMKQTALNNAFQAVLFDDGSLLALEQVCDDMVRGLSPQKAMLRELQRPQQEAVTAFLELVKYPVPGSGAGAKDVDSAPKLLSMAYLLLSALAEMPDNASALLGTCCKLQIIPTLCHLLLALSENGVSDLKDPVLAPLTDTEKFGIVQRLFTYVNIDLERLQTTVKASSCQEPLIFPLILCISLNGLCALGRPQE
ncbi:gasdermin-E [Suncus etruscus]|uniref:gasdermin-E n=1 Tax=Suncus etruscus TaxID=109475 RepID=UPI002110C540|nr:gasdermin-E [Suncus etruscus]